MITHDQFSVEIFVKENKKKMKWKTVFCENVGKIEIFVKKLNCNGLFETNYALLPQLCGHICVNFTFSSPKI